LIEIEKLKSIDNYDKMIDSRKKVINILNQYLDSKESDLIDKKEQYEYYNKQLNDLIDIKLLNKEQNNKSSQINEINENSIKDSQIEDKNENISDSENIIKENNDKIKNDTNEKNNEEIIAKLKNELNGKSQEINKLKTEIDENKKSKESILECILKEEYDKKLNELTDSEIIIKISENINNRMKSLEA